MTMLHKAIPHLALALFAFQSQGMADDREQIAKLFEAGKPGATIEIPPGHYQLDGAKPIPLASHTRVQAYGAVFHLPKSLPDAARLVCFEGKDLVDFRWEGGRFEGNVFDPSRDDNPWPPNANTRGVLVTTTSAGTTKDLHFQDITSNGVAGAVVTVLGLTKQGSDREIESYAKNITLSNCTFERSGKFMWDYGYLWQITLWPEEHSERERQFAAKYFPHEINRGPVVMKAGSDRVEFDNSQKLDIDARSLDVGQQNSKGGVVFYGDELPSNIVKGKQYFLVESQPGYVRIAEAKDKPALTFASTAGPKAIMMTDLFRGFWLLYAPEGAGPGKGAFDFVGCESVIVSGNRLSALGDTMHIQKSKNVSFSNNHILGSRMGAFFIAEYCSNVTIVGNTIDGTNGSRVMSVEKSTRDITITGNTFRGGGRGSWINQPTNLVLTNNIFENNTTKCEPDPTRGRKMFGNGTYEKYSEIYFTTHEPGGQYGNIVIRDNVFTSGQHASHAISFAAGGSSISVSGNIFQGPVTGIELHKDCQKVTIERNLGTVDQKQ